MRVLKNILLLEELKNEIEKKRANLNNLIIEDKDDLEVLKFSMELDRLIGKYYSYELEDYNI